MEETRLLPRRLVKRAAGWSEVGWRASGKLSPVLERLGRAPPAPVLALATLALCGLGSYAAWGRDEPVEPRAAVSPLASQVVHPQATRVGPGPGSSTPGKPGTSHGLSQPGGAVARLETAVRSEIGARKVRRGAGRRGSAKKSKSGRRAR